MPRTPWTLRAQKFLRAVGTALARAPRRCARPTLQLLEDRVTPASFWLSSPTYSATEDNAVAMQFEVVRDTNEGEVTVDFFTTAGTATAGTDYNHVLGGEASFTVTISDGFTSALWSIALNDDGDPELDETFTITLQNPGSGYQIGSPSTATATIIDHDGPVVTVGQGSYSVAENAGSVAVTVHLDEAPGSTVTVPYSTTDGLATAGNDYTAASGTLTFTSGGSLSQTVNVPILTDSLDEPPETFRLSLGTPTNAARGNPHEATVTITDDDPPEVSLAQSAYTVNEDAGTVTITAELTTAPESGQTVTVAYATSVGTAGSPGDFTSTSGTFTFTAGQTSATQSVAITNDAFREDDETFTFTLSGPNGATLGSPSSTTITIDDDDAMPGIYLDASTLTVGEGAGNAGLIVRLTGPLNSGEVVTVDFATADGSPSDGAFDSEDYTGRAGVVRFDASSATSQTINVPILDDDTDESDEDFTFTLSNPSGAALVSPSQTTVTITDNDSPVSGQAVLEFSAPVYDVLEDVTNAIVTITRSGNTANEVTVSYATSDLIAVQPGDYTSTTGTVTFATGVTSTTISIPIVDDTDEEAVERLLVTLSSPTATTGTVILGTHETAVVGILDNDIKVLPMPKTECGCGTSDVIRNTSMSEGRNPENRSEAPIRYQDGTVSLSESDLTSIILDAPWGHVRSWTNNVAYLSRGVQGNGWVTSQLPYLVQDDSNTFVVVTNGTASHVFHESGGTFTGEHHDPTKLEYDAVNDLYVLTDTAGNQMRFLDFSTGNLPIERGAFKEYRGASGTAMEVERDVDGRITKVSQDGTVNGQSVVEEFVYAYVGSGENAGLLRSVKLSRAIGTATPALVRQVTYTYYETGSSHGRVGDMKTATVLDAAGRSLGTHYYRYWTTDTSPGYKSGLKYVLGTEAYAQLARNEADPQGAADSTIDDYADHYFEYDSDHRVTKEIASGEGSSASGGQGTFTYSYTASSNAVGFNSWATKTVETLPDTGVRTVYTNAYGQVMLTSHKESSSATDEWVTFNRYDAEGRLLWTANPSAFVSGTKYDDTKADLLDFDVNGRSSYLEDDSGLIVSYTYGAVTSSTISETVAGDVEGYWKSMSLKRGETGTAIKQAEWTYFKRTANGVTVYPVAAEKRYRNENGTGTQTTSHAYTYYTGSTQVYQETITYPIVTISQLGPNVATTEVIVYDVFGRPIWQKDQVGSLTYMEYDSKTGGLVKQIRDVDTDLTSDFPILTLPSGWSSTNGLHLKSTYEVDDLGRTTKVTHPNGRIDYTVYNDSAHEVRSYIGWNATSNTATGPTSVSRTDMGGGYSESFTMTATPAVSVDEPTGTEPISGVVSLSRQYVNDAGQTTHSDAYFNLSGLTYSTSPSLGTENTHFYRTEYFYDDDGHLDKTVTPAGTIHRTEYDFLGRVESEWIGTDDTPTSGSWSPSNLLGANMVKLTTYLYDDTDNDGVVEAGEVGDGNLSRMISHPNSDSAHDRVTVNSYDWRNRQVAVKSGEESTTESDTLNRPIVYTDYDNLGQAIQTRQYDGDTLTVADSNADGIPDAPDSSKLRAQTKLQFDELGRMYRTEVYSVNPSTGAVSSGALDTYTWRDKRGLVIKTLAPGGLVSKNAYDSAGRMTATYLSNGAGDDSYAEADDVVGDAVVEQTEFEYDASGNVLKTTYRQRFHDATGTGVLGTPTTGVLSRVSYMGYFYDLADRLTDTVNVGTNAGSVWNWGLPVPDRSDIKLVTSQSYDSAGRLRDFTDPKGLIARSEYDDLGRVIRTIENYVDGTVSDADDKTVEYEYGPAGMTKLRVVLPSSGQQTTEYVYGVSQSPGGDGLDSHDIVKETRHPDASTGLPSTGENETVKVNRLGETIWTEDRNNTVHEFGYDVVGRPISDAVTLAQGSSVDDSVLRIETAYDGQGNAYLFTSYDAHTGGNIVNQVQRDFNGFGQLTSEWQEHDGAVNTGTSLRVQYAFTEMAGGVNHSRPTTITYPNGRVLGHGYASGLDTGISRLSYLSVAGLIEWYDYLGLAEVVQQGHSGTGLPGVILRYAKMTGESDGDAGDKYTGLDRFGRVVDQRWLDVDTGATVDRYQYTYDRNSNRTSRTNLISSTFDETYTYDGLNQLVSYSRTNVSKSWDYDAVGNWDGVTTNSVTESRTHNKQNELLTATSQTSPTYDANGNQTTDFAGNTFVYDAWNRVVEADPAATGPATRTYEYDSLGRRIEEVTGSDTRDFYYSTSWQNIEERVNGTARINYFWSPIYVDAMILRDRDADSNGTLEERLWVTQDANFNVTGLNNATGAMVERYVYDPYGTATVYDASWTVRTGGSNYAWNYLHQGLRWDGEIGKYHVRNRDYDPVQGRWTQIDPIQLDGRDFNFYRFAQNAPVVYLDASGLQATKEKQLAFEYVTSLAALQAQMSDGKAGLDLEFNFNTGTDPGRKYFVQAIKKFSFSITDKGKILYGPENPPGGNGHSFKIDQSYRGDARLQKPHIILDQRKIRFKEGESKEGNLIFYYHQTDSVAGLSDFIAIGDKPGYVPIVNKSGDPVNNFVANEKGYNRIAGSIKSLKTSFSVTYMFYQPTDTCDAAFVKKVIKDAGHDPAKVLGRIELGKTQFERLSFPALLGGKDPIVGSAKK